MAILYTDVNLNDFVDAFEKMDRGTQFSRDGLKAIYEYLTETDDDAEMIELDVIAICCGFTEYTTQEALEQYPYKDIEALKYHVNHLTTDDADKIVIIEG